MTRVRGDVHVALAATFFASGAAALIYQVAWQKILTQLVGVDAYSVTMIVAVFMLGLGLGGLCGAALTRRRLPLLRLFMLAELGIGAFGLVSSPLLRAIGASPLIARADLPVESAVYFSILVIPTVLMGISLPLLVQVFRARYDVGSALGVLYSANVLGAAAGALVAGFILVGTLGVDWTCRLVACLNLVIALIVARLARRGTDLLVAEDEAPVGTAELRLGVACVLSVVAGAVALGYEIAYFRIFSAYFGLTGYIFPTLLAAYLLCLAAGNAAFGLVARRAPTVKLLAIASAGASLATLPVLVVPELLTRIGIDPRYLVLLQTARPIVVVQLVGILGIAVVLLVPIAFLAAYFPLLARSASADPQKAGRDVGLVYFSQTMGNTLGVLVTGLVLLPSIGSVGTLKLLAILLAALPMLFLVFTRHARLPTSRRLVPALAAACLLSAIVYPADFYRSIRVAGVAPELVMESTLGVSLAYQEPSAYRLTVGREGTAAFPTVQARWDCSPNEFSALFTGDVRRALIIGIGPGTLPLCLQAVYPSVIVDVVELNPSLIELMRDRADPAIKDSLDRSTVYVTDGRRFVNKNPDRRYDFIQIGVYHVTASGSGGLFTDEFQRSMRALLTENGVMTFNAYPPAIRSTLNLFRNVLVVSRDDAIATVFASNGTMRPLTLASLRELPPSIFPAGERGVDRPEWRTACVFDREAVTGLVSAVEPQRDDLPVTEYFLTKRQNIDDELATTDLRRWGCDHGARRLSEV